MSTGLVVVGSGLAGLTAALGLADRGVTLLTKTELGAGGASAWAQGGLAAALGVDDSPEHHAADTLAVADGLADPAVVELLTRQAPERVRFLLALGAELDRDADCTLALGREAGHSRRRILHAHGDATGAELVRALTAALRRRGDVALAERTFALELVTEGGRVAGLIARRADGARCLWRCAAVVLATGGCGRLFAHTTNPPELTGDGLALAARAGARLADLEFVQFHPTALDGGRDPLPLLTEALRGEGALIIDERGRRFLLDHHPAAELAPRDVVARAIWRVQQRGGRAFLDATGALGARLAARFPTVFELCRRDGLDPRIAPLPITPAAHYHIGGIAVDGRGRSSLPGLWAAGENACTGAHGANRLASNSLLEAMVIAGRVAEDVATQLPLCCDVPASPLAAGAGVASAGALVGAGVCSAAAEASRAEAEVVSTLRALMWRDVGLVRDHAGLTRALQTIVELARRLGPGAGEAHNLLEVAQLVTAAALARRESRGVHFRADFPAHLEGAAFHSTMIGRTVEAARQRVA
ncbi:MAG: L-aspartate oxidase [Proteobacteria bacterium]|nr:L-aspartate oxidase [Pseudomonadota bacterium]